MNVLLIFPSFIIAFVVVLYYERKIREPKNTSDTDGKLWLYIGKPVRVDDIFESDGEGC